MGQSGMYQSMSSTKRGTNIKPGYCTNIKPIIQNHKQSRMLNMFRTHASSNDNGMWALILLRMSTSMVSK